MAKKKQKGPSGKKWQAAHKRKRYDVEMIRDFLDHLLWEVRINHFENTADVGAINPELVEQLGKYIRKYNGVLLPATVINREGATEDQAKATELTYRQIMRDKRQEQMEHLESLQELFADALKCASLPASQGIYEIRLNAAEIPMDDDDEPEPPPPLNEVIPVCDINLPSVQAEFRAADVILAVDAETKKQHVAYGRDVVQRIASTGETEHVAIVYVEVDMGNDLPNLLSVIEELHGHHDWLDSEGE